MFLASIRLLVSPTMLAWLLCGSAFGDPPGRAISPPEADRPTLFLVGDSTVKCGRGDGTGGMWGWGQVLTDHFDTRRIHVENRALGGRSSRTYRTEGHWSRVLEALKPGDFVLIQFGHNDNGRMFDTDRPRASIKGNGNETREGVVESVGKSEVVHSFGWYLRHYASDVKSRGATPIILSLVPRDIWRDGRVIRSDNDYAKWAREAAEEVGAAFIDLNARVADRYEAIGQPTVHETFFTPHDHTHTSKAGAEANASCVADGIRALDDCRLKEHLKTPDPSAPLENEPHSTLRFDFGPGDAAAGYKRVVAEQRYTPTQGFGFEQASDVENATSGDDDLLGDCCVSDRPFYFSVALSAGNYRVRVVREQEASDRPLTIKAELRRLMVEQVRGASHEFLVNVRTPAISDGRQVGLKPREVKDEWWAWDDKLTLEFNGPRPSIAGLTIEQAPDVATIFLAGDSTVADQPREPWNSWGQMLPRFFGPTVAVANYAESGESIRSSLAARRFEKIFDAIRPGDYLFIQFGHNDMKSPAEDALANYRADLRRLVVRIRGLGATPVLVTSMERKSGVSSDTLGGYPQTVRDIAQEDQVALIDLHSMSKALYSALGSELGEAFVDGTHHNSYGSYQLARCVVAGIREQVPTLAVHLHQDPPPIDLIHPDPVAGWNVPISPTGDAVRPEGS